MESQTNIESKGAPSVNSSDPNERKLARRMRIKARLATAEKEKAIADGSYVEAEPEKPLISETIETSEDALRQLYLEGKEFVSNVMVASNAKEVARRETETEERHNRLERLKEESALALEKLDEISSKWEMIMDINGPLELFQNMKEQKAKCLELIEQKNELIKNFQLELKLADEKFMKGRKEMYEELGLLTRRIDDQVLLMKKAYRIELGQIEEAIDKTRTETMDKHQKVWLSLYNQREKEETSNIDSKFQLVENFHEELHKLHVDHEEKYRATRIHLETDIQILEQELEQVKALCLLNSEKLDYNYQVLKKREEENVYIKNHQKRRLNKLQDLVNTLKKKIDEKRQNTDEEYKKLTCDVERYYNNICATEKKAERLAQVNNEKFESIWDMKDEEAKALIKKILTANLVIHEQILGVEWIPPANINFNKTDLPTYKTALFVVRDVLKNKIIKNKSSTHGKILPMLDGGPEVIEAHKRLLHHIFQLIADQSGFLMEEKLDELLAPYNKEEKTFVQLDNVFAAMGIQTEQDIETMKKVFLPYSVCLLCDNRTSSSLDVQQDNMYEFPRVRDFTKQHSILQMRELEEKVSKLRLQAKANAENGDSRSKRSSVYNEELMRRMSIRSADYNKRKRSPTIDSSKGDRSIESGKDPHVSKPKCNITHPLIIEKYLVLRALKDFVSVCHAHKIPVQRGIEEKLEQKRFTISRLISKEDVIMYWNNFRDLIPPHFENLWDGISVALTKYLAVLQERHELNVKAQSLRRQNQELKRLLAYYKISHSRSELKLPMLLPVPNEPIDTNEIITISTKLSF